MPSQPRTLSDLRVLEYGQLVSAPFCARLMAGLGADVIKIEPPTGDPARRAGPFPRGIPHPEKSGLFLSMNLDKRGITLDLTNSYGPRVLRRLVRETDILVENSPPSFLDELELDYEALREVNPDLIMVSITPFGQDDPYSRYKAYDLNVWHAAGWGYLWRERRSGEEPGSPVRPPAYLPAFQAAYNALTAVLGTLYYRDCGGGGQHIDLSQQEAMAFIMAGAFPILNFENRVMGRSIAIPNSVPSGPLPTKDGYVLLSAVEEHQFRGLAQLLGDPEWTREEWTEDIEGRRLNWDVIDAFVMEWLEDKLRDEVVEEAIERRLPASPVGLTAKEILNDRHLAQRQFFTEVDHPVAGRLRYPSLPCKLSETEATTTRPAPLLGQHNEDIYCKCLGHSKSDLARMRSSGVI